MNGILSSTLSSPLSLNLRLSTGILESKNEINRKIICQLKQTFINSVDVANEWKVQMLRFQRLVERAKQNKIDVTRQTKGMKEILNTRISSGEPHQSRSMRDLYELKILQKYNKEIGLRLEFQRLIRMALMHQLEVGSQVKNMQQALLINSTEGKGHDVKEMKDLARMNKELAGKITQHLRYSLFHKHVERFLDVNCNSDFQWKEHQTEFQKLIKIAKEKGVDISEQMKKMETIFLDRPDSSPHQFVPIRVLYEIKMLRKYNEEIARKIAKHGLFFANKEKLQSHLLEEKEDVESKFQEWVNQAQKQNLDVSQIVDKINQIDLLQPDPKEKHQIASIGLLSGIEWRRMYCIRIICQLAESEIRKIAALGREKVKLEKQLGLINQCENFLLKQAPKVGSVKTIQQAEAKYHFVMEELERITKSFK